MKAPLFRSVLLCWWLVILVACTTAVPRDPKLASIDVSCLPPPDLELKIAGLRSCTTSPDTTLRLNSAEPVNIIVHGGNGSAARFRALAQLFAFHGQQSVCFSYNHRDSLDKSAAEFATALGALSGVMESRRFNIIAHSQGGLIARRALVAEPGSTLATMDFRAQLTTISTPFAGVEAARHCASPTARVVSLGLVIPICKLISGDKWFDITHRSPFIQQPGELLPQVYEHLKIVTDERDSCRRFDGTGRCVESDYVFSVEEQYLDAIDLSPVVNNVELRAGHARIVGDHQEVPRELIELLQQQGLMHTTPVARQAQFKSMLERVYLN